MSLRMLAQARELALASFVAGFAASAVVLNAVIERASRASRTIRIGASVVHATLLHGDCRNHERSEIRTFMRGLPLSRLILVDRGLHRLLHLHAGGRALGGCVVVARVTQRIGVA